MRRTGFTRTANPALNASVFERYAGYASGEGAMTINGTVNKTALLLVLVIASSSYVWKLFYSGQDVTGLMMAGVVGGLICAIVTAFRMQWAPYTAPAYAVLEGLALGGISAFFQTRFPGIVMQAVALTFGVMFALLFAYRSGMIRVTEKFRLGVIAAGGGIFITYLLSMVLGLFGMSFPLIHSSGPFGIIFSLFVVVVASLFLVLDFDFIEQGARAGAPRFMEWYGAFGLMVTLVWLYLEILNLLAKLQSRD